MVPALAAAAVAAGADGLLIEVHCDPGAALSDGGNSLTPDTFAEDGPTPGRRRRSRRTGHRMRGAACDDRPAAGAGRDGRGTGPVEDSLRVERDGHRAQRDRRGRLRPPEAPRHRAGPALLGRRVRPTRLPRRDRHGADRRRGPRVPGRPVAEQAERARRPPPGARRVRRLLGHEVGGRAPREVGVPRQPLAQRRAGLPPTGCGRASATTCPYDRFARALLTSSGSNFRVGPVNFYRAAEGHEPKAIATSVALVFMGSRLAAWPPERQAQMAAFFSQVGYKATAEWKEEIVFFDPDKGREGDRCCPTARPCASRRRTTRARRSRRGSCRRRTPGSPARPSTASGSGSLGRGIVHEADDMRPDNPPSNPELLAYLEREFVASRFDVKALYRLDPEFDDVPVVVDPGEGERGRRGELRPRDRQAARRGGPGRRGVPDHRNHRAVLERDPGAVHVHPARSAVDRARRRQHPEHVPGDVRTAAAGTPACCRSGTAEPSASQRLYLLNSGDIQRKLQQGPKLQALLQAPGNPRQLVTGLYLAVLSRFPTEDEVKTATAYGQAAGGEPAPGRAGCRVGAAQQRGVQVQTLDRLKAQGSRLRRDSSWRSRDATCFADRRSGRGRNPPGAA